MTYTDQAIVIKRTDFREAERLITLLSKKRGKLILRAPGAKKPTSRKTYHLEVFNHINFLAASGRNLDIITETAIIDEFLDLKKDLNKIAVGFYGLELIDRLVKEEIPHADIFNLTLDFIKSLSSSNHSLDLSLRLVWEEKLLKFLGFWPAETKSFVNKSDLSLRMAFNRSLIEWVLEGKIRSEEFLDELSGRSHPASWRGETF